MVSDEELDDWSYDYPDYHVERMAEQARRIRAEEVRIAIRSLAASNNPFFINEALRTILVSLPHVERDEVIAQRIGVQQQLVTAIREGTIDVTEVGVETPGAG